MIDFANSFTFWTVPPHRTTGRHQPWGNSARIQIDARCEIAEPQSGRRQEYFLITPCRSEWMYVEDGMLQQPNWEYCQVVTPAEEISVSGSVTPRHPTYRRVGDVFSEYDIRIRRFGCVRELAGDAAVVQATLDYLPINAVTEIEVAGLRAVMEYPVKTMNVLKDRLRFQVDTGPLAFPDLSRAGEHWIHCFCKAFVVYNTFDRAEFVLNRPTPLGGSGPLVMDYQEIHKLPARHRLFAAEG